MNCRLFGFFAYNTHLPLFLKTNLSIDHHWLCLLYLQRRHSYSEQYFSGLNARWSAARYGGPIRSVTEVGGFHALTKLSEYASLQLMTLILGGGHWLHVLSSFDVRSSRWSALMFRLHACSYLGPTLSSSKCCPRPTEPIGFELFIIDDGYLVFPWLDAFIQERGRRLTGRTKPEPEPRKKLHRAQELMEGLPSALARQ